MALFGDLKHIPFTELIPPLVKRTGWLTVHTPRAIITLEVNQGELIRGFRNQQSLNTYTAKEVLIELVNTLEAPFEFTGSPVSSNTNTLNYFLPNLMAELEHGSVPSLGTELIDPDTRFRTSGKTQAIPGSLGIFFFQANYLLKEPGGASSQEIAHYLRLPLVEVQNGLYRLRQMGYIGAVEAFRQEAPSGGQSRRAPGQNQSPPTTPSQPSMVQRLLQALRGRFGLKIA